MIDIQDFTAVDLSDLSRAIVKLHSVAMAHAKLIELFPTGKSMWECDGRMYFYDNGRLIPQGAAKEYKR